MALRHTYWKDGVGLVANRVFLLPLQKSLGGVSNVNRMTRMCLVSTKTSYIGSHGYLSTPRSRLPECDLLVSFSYIYPVGFPPFMIRVGRQLQPAYCDVPIGRLKEILRSNCVLFRSRNLVLLGLHLTEINSSAADY